MLMLRSYASFIWLSEVAIVVDELNSPLEAPRTRPGLAQHDLGRTLAEGLDMRM